MIYVGNSSNWIPSISRRTLKEYTTFEKAINYTFYQMGIIDELLCALSFSPSFFFQRRPVIVLIKITGLKYFAW